MIDALVDRASAEMLEGFEGIGDEVDFATYVDATIEAAAAGWRTHGVVFLAAAERSSHADESTDRWRAIMRGFVDLLARRIAREPHAGTAEEAARRAEIGCWMVERNFYMLFSRQHDATEEQQVVASLKSAMKLVLLPAS